MQNWETKVRIVMLQVLWIYAVFVLIPVKSAQGEIIEQRYGKGGIKRTNRSSYQPIHLAAENGHLVKYNILIILIMNLG